MRSKANQKWHAAVVFLAILAGSVSAGHGQGLDEPWTTQPPPVTPPRGAAKAVITGPSSTQPGDLAIISSQGSSGAAYKWVVLPKSATGRYFVSESGRQVIFASRTPGDYTFILAVADDNDIALAAFTLRNGTGPGPSPPSPDPVPPQPPEPGPTTPLAEYARQQAIVYALPAEMRTRTAPKLADALERAAATASAGVYATTAAARAGCREASREALGDDTEGWAAWNERIAKRIAANAAELTTPQDYAAVWRQLASGLRGL